MKNINKKNKALIGLSLAILLFLTGVSYSAWSEVLSIKGIFTTGSFKIEFGDEDDIIANLVTLNGKKVNVKDKVNVNVDSRLLNNNKKANITLKDDLLNQMITQDYMLQIKYPLKATEDSTIKAMNSMTANFNNADKTVSVTPTIEISSDGDSALLKYLSEGDFKVTFDIYNEIEVTEDGNYAVVYIKAKDMGSVPEYSVGYDELMADLPQYVDISYDNPEINLTVNAEYSFEVDIAAEQFNSGKWINIGG